MHWLSETLRKAPGNGANEPNLGAGTGLIAEQERGPSRSIGHFQQVRAVAPLTRRAESSLSDNLAPQVGFEPTTLRLTAEWLIGASRCKHNYLGARKGNIRGIWGDFGGTPGCREQPAFGETSDLH